MNHLEISTPSRSCCVDITRQVQEIVSKQAVSSGLVVVCSLHTTAGITINENADPDVMEDVLAALERLAPHRGAYAHSEGNSDAHLKTTLVGLSVTIPIESGQLVLGTWQGIYFCEFDGPRRRKIGVQELKG